MDSGNRHFSHVHNLTMHQAYETANMSCSGCNMLVNGTICEFDLHVICAQPYSNPTLANNYSHGHEAISQSGPNSYPAQNAYIPTSAHNQNTSGHHSYMHSQHVGNPSGQTGAHNPQYP
nr:hypothetical protein [Tanacetum cinerariifolium]